MHLLDGNLKSALHRYSSRNSGLILTNNEILPWVVIMIVVVNCHHLYGGKS